MFIKVRLAWAGRAIVETVVRVDVRWTHHGRVVRITGIGTTVTRERGLDAGQMDGIDNSLSSIRNQLPGTFS